MKTFAVAFCLFFLASGNVFASGVFSPATVDSLDASTTFTLSGLNAGECYLTFAPDNNWYDTVCSTRTGTFESVTGAIGITEEDATGLWHMVLVDYNDADFETYCNTNFGSPTFWTECQASGAYRGHTVNVTFGQSNPYVPTVGGAGGVMVSNVGQAVSGSLPRILLILASLIGLGVLMAFVAVLVGSSGSNHVKVSRPWSAKGVMDHDLAAFKKKERSKLKRGI